MRTKLNALVPMGFATLAGQATLQANPCTVKDWSYVVTSTCDRETWQGIVQYEFNGNWGTYGVGWFSGGNICDPGGLNCDGSSRPFNQYKATKSLQSWPQWHDPMFVQFSWNYSNEQLQWESCLAPNGESAARVTNYNFPRNTGWYTIWCD